MGQFTRKLIAISLAVVIVVLLSVCGIRTYENIKRNTIETEAKEYMTIYLSRIYPGFTIKSCEQIVVDNNWDNDEVLNLTKLQVVINGTEYIFYYNSQNDMVYSNVNYKKIIKELQNNFLKNGTLNKLNAEFKINLFGDKDILAVRHEDETLEQVIDTLQNNKDEYVICAEFYVQNKEN